MHRLFKTPELVSLICACLDASYHPESLFIGDSYIRRSIDPCFRRTALVSRQFYLGVVPYLWECTNLSALFKRGLIPAKLEQKGDKTRAYISKSISPKKMSRFRFFAPCIKVLCVYDNEIKVFNWEHLVSFSQNTELLPNLIELSLSLLDQEVFSVFLSRSTRHISVRGPHRSTFATSLLEAIARTCPGIRTLEFHPKPHKPASTTGAQTKIFQGLTLFSSFQNLRLLKSTPIILQSPVLELVAQLPRLKRLVVRPSYRGANWDPSRCQQLPTGSFPALKSLNLGLGNSHDAKRFWELIPLPKLKCLELKVRSVTGDNELRFIPTFCQASPRVTSLSLTFPRSGEPHKISADIFEHLALLPLDQRFSLKHAVFDFEEPWVMIADAWPDLRKICCLDQPADLDDLLFLSSNLPELVHVKCDLDLEGAALNIPCDWRADGRPSFYPDLRKLIIKQFELRELMPYNVGGVARYIAYFWPEVDVKSVQEDFISEDSDDDDSDTEREALLNKQGMFRMFRELVRAYAFLFHGD